MRKWISAIAILALLAAWFFLIRPAPELGSFTMSDGTVVEVLKVTTGPVHRFRYDNRWQDYLGYVLPNSLRAKLNPRVLEFRETNSNSLMVWTKSPNITQPGLELTVEDESGVEVPVGRAWTDPMFKSGGTPPVANARRVVGWIWPAPTTSQTNAVAQRYPISVAGFLVALLPFHSREITLGFHDRQGNVGSFKLANPAYRLARSMHIEHPPVVKTNGDITVKLVDAYYRRNSNKMRVSWSIRAEVMRDAAVLPDWQIDGIDLFANERLFAHTGWPRSLLTSGIGAETPVRQDFDLWPDAPWTLRLWATQHRNFKSNEIWSLNDVPVTNTVPGKVEKREWRQVGGKKVELLGVRWERAMTPGLGSLNFTLAGRPKDVTCCFAAPPWDEGVRITFLRGRDDQGRIVERPIFTYDVPSSVSNGPPFVFGQPEVMIYGFSLHPAPDAQTLTLEFAVHQARSVDFVVKPTLSK